jgi:hypothetical protein
MPENLSAAFIDLSLELDLYKYPDGYNLFIALVRYQCHPAPAYIISAMAEAVAVYRPFQR